MATQRLTKAAPTLTAASAGDTIFINEGGFPVNANLDYSGVNRGVTMEVSQSYSGDIGDSSTQFKIAFTTRLIFGGTGHMWWISDSLDSDTSALVQVTGGGHLHFVSGGPATRAEVGFGILTAGNAASITNARIGKGGTAYLYDTGSAGTVTLAENHGGTLYSERPHTTLNHVAGRTTLAADSAGATNAHGTINVNGPGLVIKDSGTITALNCNLGIPDVSQLANTLTITDTTINMLIPGAQAFLDHPLITFTNTPTRLYNDGRPV